MDDERKGGKFVLPLSRLERLVTTAAIALTARPALPVLGCVLLEATADGMSARTTCYETSLQVTGTPVEASGRLLLEHAGLAGVLASLAKGRTRKERMAIEVTISGDGGPNATVTAARMSVEVASYDPDDLPMLVVEHPIAAEVECAALVQALGQVSSAAGNDDTLPMLCGVQFEFREGSLQLAATDRFHLATARIPAQVDAEALASGGISGEYAPRPLAQVMTRIAGRLSGQRVRIGVERGKDGGQVSFTCGDLTVSTFAGSGSFPKYEHLFNVGGVAVQVDRVALLTAAQRADAVLGVYGNANLGAWLVTTESGLRVIPRHASRWEEISAPEVAAEHDDPGVDAVIQPKYLVAALEAVDGDRATVFMHSSSRNRPLLVVEAGSPTDGSATRRLFMPINGGSGLDAPLEVEPSEDGGKFSCELGPLGDALKTTHCIVADAVKGTPSAGVLLEARGDTMVVSADDGSVRVEMVVPAAEASGEVLVDEAQLRGLLEAVTKGLTPAERRKVVARVRVAGHEVVRKRNEEGVEEAVAGDDVAVVEAQGYRLPVNLYRVSARSVVEGDTAPVAEVPREGFEAAVRQVQGAAGRKPGGRNAGRPELHSIYVGVRGDRAVLAATDRFRLAVSPVAANWTKVEQPTGAAVVPDVLTKFAASAGDDCVVIGWGEVREWPVVSLSSGNVTVLARAVVEEYVDFDRVLADAASAEAVVERKELVLLAERWAKVGRSAGSKSVGELRVVDGGVDLGLVRDGQVGVPTRVTATVTGEWPEAGVQYELKRLIDALKAFGTQEVTLSRSGDGMTLRVSGGSGAADDPSALRWMIAPEKR